MSAPLMSIIVGVHNGADFLGSALSCILSQDYDPLEIIIVNDGSTDQTGLLAEEWVRSNPEQIQLIHCPRGGIAAARNTGLRAAHGDLIGMLDVDDLWLPGTLSAFGAALTCHPQVSVMQGYIRRIWLANAPAGPRYERDFVPYLAMNTGSMFFRRSVFNTVGLFDEHLSQNEDTDLHLRIREAGLQICVLERLALIYRMHDHNMTNGWDPKRSDFFKVLRNSLQRRRARGQHCSLDGLHYLSDARRAWPSLSVVIPLADSKMGSIADPTLQRTLASISAQDYPNMEIIFVHSSSGAQNLAALSAACSPTRIGRVEIPKWDLLDAFNAGAMAASGDVLAWCQPGDIWSTHRLHMQLGYLLPDRSDQAVTGLVHFVLDPTQSYPDNLLVHLEGHSYQDVLGTILIHRSIFLASGGFRKAPGLSPLAVITEWFVRLKEDGVRVRAVPRYVLFKLLEHEKAAGRRLATEELLVILHGAIKRKHGED
jgi:glycosyltransferase involved in cell wall biosynthesis